jgi:hypothetical protein
MSKNLLSEILRLRKFGKKGMQWQRGNIIKQYILINKAYTSSSQTEKMRGNSDLHQNYYPSSFPVTQQAQLALKQLQAVPKMKKQNQSTL